MKTNLGFFTSMVLAFSNLVLIHIKTMTSTTSIYFNTIHNDSTTCSTDNICRIKHANDISM